MTIFLPAFLSLFDVLLAARSWAARLFLCGLMWAWGGVAAHGQGPVAACTLFVNHAHRTERTTGVV